MGKRNRKRSSVAKTPRKALIRDTYSPHNNAYSGMNGGGLYNNSSGIGGSNDKGRASFFLPTIITSKDQLEVMYNESWAAKRYIDLGVDQMFIKPRCFNTSDPSSTVTTDIADKYTEYLDCFNINTHIANSMKAGKLYGSAFMVLVTAEAPLYTPLNVNMLRQGDLLNILVFDRFSVSVDANNYNLASKTYGEPEVYRIIPRHGAGFTCHKSRLIRFDGQKPLNSDGWITYDFNYGVSEIVTVLQSIYQESQVANSISQLVEESSIPVMKSKFFRDATGSNSMDSPSLSELTGDFNRNKSIYNMMFIDSEDDISRLEVNMTGIKDLLNAFAGRLAAAGGYQATVFLGKSPQGMNATGDSDLRINSMKVESDQQHKLRPVYTILDQILLRTSGLGGQIKLDYSFPSILEDTEKEQADAALVKSQVATSLEGSGLIDVTEAREMLSGDPIIGDLDIRNEDDFSQAFNSSGDLANGTSSTENQPSTIRKVDPPADTKVSTGINNQQSQEDPTPK